ncbi:acyltransferase [Massilia sp. ST3]|uniref:acyltransferase family protein n=1 Tax=Massilia sp. ST3 TaxID=2824903 RepID=UPI001B82CF4C|nr:acyltransferase [Massilia sp. ST3]MBQ5947744.1 acyltransferase [Massilia sp. ST3]
MKNRSADGLRGLAALNVAITHFVAAFLPWLLYYNYGVLFPRFEGDSAWAEVFSSPLLTLFYNGHFAVLIFFVLSGYVLTLPYFEQPAAVAATALRRRLWARYLRLNVPIAAAVALSWLAYRYGLYQHAAAAPLSGSLKWLGSVYPPGLDGALALKEALFGSIVLGQAAFVPPLWTLKVEFIGSLYILLFYLARPARFTWLPLALVLPLLYAVHGEQSVYYYAIFAGSMLHGLRLGRPAQAALLLLGLYLGAYQHFRAMYGFLPAPQLWDVKSAYNTLGAVCLCAAVLSGLGRGLLESRAVQFLGRVSFSLYLLHFMILCAFSAAIYVRFPREPLYIGAGFAAYLALCLGAAALFERWVDRPAIRLSRRFGALVCPGAAAPGETLTRRQAP